MSNVDSLHEVVTLRARVAELERERDAVTACLAGREKHLGERIQTLIESGDLSARAVAFHADRAAEMERERDEARSRVTVMSDAWVAATADAARLREALRNLTGAVSAHLTRGEDETPGQWNQAWAQALAALASAPSAEPTPHEAYMRVAKAVHRRHLRIVDEWFASAAPNSSPAHRLGRIDLAAVVAKALEVGT